MQIKDADALHLCWFDLMPMSCALLSAQALTILIGAGEYDDVRWFVDTLEEYRFTEVS